MNDNVEIISDLQSYSFVKSFFELSDESHFWFEWRMKALMQQLKETDVPIEKNLKALDVGCGVGVLRKQIEAAMSWDVDCVDIDYHALQQVESGRGRTMYYDILEKHENFLATYDVVIAFDVIEHITESKVFIEAMLAHLKPDGFLIINVPALQFLYSRYDEVQGHVKRYDIKSMKVELNDFNLSILTMNYWGAANVPILYLRKWLLRADKKSSSEDILRKGFQPPGKFVNSLFRKIMAIEMMLLKKPPFGSSLLLVARKNI
jgi:SAM-dependent methyltransferase